MNPAPHEGLPGPFDVRNWNTGLSEEIGERVEPLAADAAATKPAAQRRKDDPVLGIDGIHAGGNPDDVQESTLPRPPLPKPALQVSLFPPSRRFFSGAGAGPSRLAPSLAGCWVQVVSTTLPKFEA